MSTPPAQRKDDKQDSPDNKAALDASRHVMVFALLVFATLLTSNYPLPWKLAATVFGLCAIGYGIYTVVKAIGAKLSPAITVTVLIGVFLAGWMVLQTAAMAIVWPVQAGYEECVAGAITEQASRQCTEDYQERLSNLIQIPAMPSSSS